MFLNSNIKKISENNERGIKWIGLNGLANMETSALLTIFFMLFFSAITSMGISVLVVTAKCFSDKSGGSNHEFHDFICSIIGVIFGALLGFATPGLGII